MNNLAIAGIRWDDEADQVSAQQSTPQPGAPMAASLNAGGQQASQPAGTPPAPDPFAGIRWDTEPEPAGQIGGLRPEGVAKHDTPHPLEEVPEWGRGNPNLYGAAGAVKETAGALTKAATNLLPSAVGVVGDVAQAFIHPVDTAKAVGQTAMGAVELAIPGEQGHEDMARAVGQFFTDRYGSTEAFRKHFEEDPAAVAMDVSTLLAGGGAMLKGAGVAAKTAGAGRAGETLGLIGKAASEAAQVVDPLHQAAKVGGAVMQGAGKVGAEMLGATTGAGPEAIRQAARGEPGFKEAIRGRVSADDLLANAKDALTTIREERNATYRQRLAGLKGVDRELDITPIHRRLEKMLNGWNIALNTDGTLDFGRSRLNPQEAADVQGVLQEIGTWGERAGDLTPAGLDILKSRMDNFYSDSSRARMIVTALRNDVKRTIVKAVPEYRTMVGDYEVTTRQLHEMERALSLNDRAMMDTAVKKLASTMRENFEFRRQLLEQMESSAGVELRPQIAGVTMQPTTPKGLIGKGAAAMAAGGSWITANPAALGGLLLASPLVVGEFLHASGVGRRQVNKMLHSPEFRKARAAYIAVGGNKGAYQAGRIAEATAPPEQVNQ